MARPKKELNSAVIKPMIRANGEKHLLEELFDGDPDDMPEIRSVGYMRLHKGTGGWVSYIITTKGREVINIEIDEPNLKDIAEESAKIAFVSTFIDHEAF